MVRVEVWGNMACFTRPEFKVERITYDVITPSAARAILDSIYWHPGLKWHVDKIYVLNPIQYTDVMRNEVKLKASGQQAIRAMKGEETPLFLDSVKQRTQRTTKVLQNVHYVIEAHFTMTKNASDSDNEGKFCTIMKNRLAKGRCFSEPYFGCREFPAFFREWNGGIIPTIHETRDLGYMLYDMDYTVPGRIMPVYFKAKMENGVVDTGKEVVQLLS